MRVFIVFASILMASNAKLDPELVSEIMGKVTEAASKCAEVVKPSNEDIATLMEHKVPESHEGKCMIYCVHREMGLVTEEGRIDFEGGKKIMDKVKASDPELYEKLYGIYKTCEGSDYFVENDPCETSGNFVICGVKGAKKEGISFDIADL